MPSLKLFYLPRYCISPRLHNGILPGIVVCTEQHIMEETVKVTKPFEAITVITIARPHARNAVDSKTAESLYQKFLEYEADETQKVCILTGAGATFCSGADLKAFDNLKRSKLSREDNIRHSADSTNIIGSIGPMGPSRLQLKKPCIAAVAGYAVAGGLELSLLADLRVVEEDAMFGVFCRRWGVPLIDGGTVRLQAIVGYGRAMDMILTGRPVGAQEALAMGLANRVVAKGDSLREALALAQELIRFPYACLLADRTSLGYSAFSATSFGDAMANEFEGGRRVLSQAFQGAAAFTAGRGRHGDYGDWKL
jgi:enoyl-CoA hydratase/carnithine racemase